MTGSNLRRDPKINFEPSLRNRCNWICFSNSVIHHKKKTYREQIFVFSGLKIEKFKIEWLKIEELQIDLAHYQWELNVSQMTGSNLRRDP